MSLATGSRLGPYEITGKLGEGGMGLVFKAKDSHLGRDVALKVLPDSFAGDAERLARFEREAKLLAQLNHSNIAQIYGLETSGETRALVMELVEGPTLAERLEHGPMPLAESLAISLQIAQALEEAHEKGIVHRDLKPQNIKASVEGRVKVLDFGLAKAMDPAGAASGEPSASLLARSPTLTLGATVQGVILGTAAYMAPEQAKGLAVDKRADVWAFGVVLYEMLTGARLFGGETVPETLAGVIRAEIDLGQLPADTPPAVRRLLERCLERDPRRRLRDIGEARVLLERPIEPVEVIAGANAGAGGRRGLPLAAVALAALALGAAGAWLLRGRAVAAPAAASVVRLQVPKPVGGEFGEVDGPIVLSPDGTRIVFRLEKSPQALLAVRSLDRLDQIELKATGGSYEPSWSPDGKSVLYFDQWLTRIDAEGLQPPQRLAPIRDGRGASWGADGTILYAPAPAGTIYRVNAEGGEPAEVTKLDPAAGEIAHVRPQWLPGGERFLYLVKADEEHTGIYVGSLDGKLKKRILPSSASVRFVEPDAVLMAQEGRLIARRLDFDKLELSREARTIAEGVEYTYQYDLLPASATVGGRLIYHSPSTAQVRQLARVSEAGKRVERIGEPGDQNLDLSPDGRFIASNRVDDKRNDGIWVRDLARGVSSKLTDELRAFGPVWSPDGRSIAYSTIASTGVSVVIRPASGGMPRNVWTDPFIGEPIDWSPDGTTLLVEVASPGQRANLVLVSADGSGRVVPFVATAADEQSGRFSPDGRWIAYCSDESGRSQIFVEPYPKTGARWLATPRGGESPRWSLGGAELVYVEPGDRSDASNLTTVSVEVRGADLVLGVAKPVGTIPSRDYELLPGGSELLVSLPVAEGERLPPMLVENWTSLLPPR